MLLIVINNWDSIVEKTSNISQINGIINRNFYKIKNKKNRTPGR